MNRLERSVRAYIDYLCSMTGVDVNKSCQLLTKRRITSNMACLFIDGHCLQDKIIMPALKMIKRSNKENDIK